MSSITDEQNIALNASNILNNFGGLQDNDLVQIANLNDDDNGDESRLIKQSQYYDIDGMSDFLSTNTNNISVISWNIQSLNSKFNEIAGLIHHLEDQSLHFDVICLQESWLSEEDNYNLFKIDNYTFYKKDVEVNCSSHGGLIIYVRNEICVNKIEFLRNRLTYEGIAITIKTAENKKIKIINIYRPPRETFDEFINDFIPTISDQIKNTNDVILTGDFNLNLLNLNNRKIYSYFDHMLNLHLLPKITFPTHFLDNTCTLIDNIFTKYSPASQSIQSGILISNISDHFPIFISIDLDITKLRQPKFITTKISNTGSLNNLNTELKSINFEQVLSTDTHADPNSNYNVLQNIITSHLRKHFPVKKVRFNKYKHKHNAWITNGIIRSIKFKDKLYKLSKTTSMNNPLYLVYKQNLRVYKNILKKLIKDAKYKYYENQFQINTHDVKKTWKVINSVIKDSQKNVNFPSFLKNRNVIVSDQISIIEEMNLYFTNIGRKLAPESNQTFDSFSNFFTLTHNHEFHFEQINENDVLKIIDHLKSKESEDADGLSSKILKNLSRTLCKPIALIINQSLSTGRFPDKLKIAKIIPIYKGNESDINSVNNYRPISILPIISKIFEKIVYNQLYNFFDQHNLFFSSQYGFRQDHSTEFATLELTNKIHEHLNNGLNPIAVYMDLSKAFDTINHDILINKLKHYGVTGTELEWFVSYLANRFQYVTHSFSKSSLKEITTGVPQGSILGPLLFIIYINDLPSISDLDIIQYADDTCLLIPFKHTLDQNKLLSTTNQINNKLKIIYEWLSANKLSLNVNKTKCTLFHYKQKVINTFPNIQINKTPLNFVQHYKFLGILIDDTLSWDAHIHYLSNKLSKINGLLSKLKHFFPKKILLTIYNSLFLSNLNYGITIWGFGGTERVDTIQKKAIRNVNSSSYIAHTEPICKELRILLFKDIFNLACLKFYHKYKNNNLPKYFTQNGFFKYNKIRRNNLRVTNTAIFPDYITETVNYRPIFFIPRTIKSSSEKRLSIYLPRLLNNRFFPQNLLDKVDTHSINGISTYFKNLTIEQYKRSCIIADCYVCNQSAM